MAKNFLDNNGLNTLWQQICKTFPARDGKGAIPGSTWDISIIGDSGYAGIAGEANKLAKPILINLSGAITGNVNFDGSEDVTIETSVNHSHSEYTLAEDFNGFTEYVSNYYYGNDVIDTKLDSKANTDGSNATGTWPITAQSANSLSEDRLYNKLVPSGWSIGANVNLNSVNYIKVGKYYCSSNTTAATLKNCPISVAFMMEVYSPLSTTIDNESTSTYVYRIRKITQYNTGLQFIQYVYSGATKGSFTYNTWRLIPMSPVVIDTTDMNGSNMKLGGSVEPIYINSSGYFEKCDQLLSYSDFMDFVDYAEGNFTKVNSTNSTDKLYILGTTSQASKLTPYSNENVYIESNSIKAQGGFYETSDERLKNIIKPITVDFDKLAKLRKVYFNWKDNSTKTEIGMIAQDVQKVYPELVSESNGQLSLAYDKLSVISLEAIDILYKENKKLKERIEHLESTVKKIVEKIG